MTPPRPRLGVRVDGVALPDDEARELWARFSAWMEEHRGDLAGFAAREGFASVHPGVDAGLPVLLASRSAGQRPYADAVDAGPAGGPGGSAGRHERRDRDRSRRGKSKK